MRSASEPLLRPIRLRLVAWSVLVILLVVGALGVTVYAALAASFRDQIDRDLAAQSDLVAPRGVASIADAPQGAGREGYHGGVFVVLFSADGRLLANPQRLDEEEIAGATSVRSGYGDVQLDDDPGRALARDVLVAGARARLVVGRSTELEHEALENLVRVLLATAAGAAALAFAGAWFIAGRALVPIAAAFRRQREFVADASHELRTPLTTLRAATDLLDRHRDEPLGANAQVLEDMRHELARTERLVEDLLLLARSDLDELTLARGRVDLLRLAEGIARRLSPVAAGRGVTLTHQGESTVVDADPDRLEQAVLVLVDNALGHSPRGGHVTLVAERAGRGAVLRVRDDGPGIPQEELAHVFERFYRGDRSRADRGGGAGLGLAIARTLVRVHGGDLTLESAPGAGTVATIRLPQAE